MKQRSKKVTALLLVLTTLTIALSGCGNASDETSGENSSQITVGIAQDLEDSLDPHKAEAAATREILFNVFEGLMKPDTDGNLVPAVASKYEVSDDGLVYTFTLRDGIKFHNGNLVTVSDVKASLETCADSSSGAALIPAFSNISSIDTPDDKTIVITLAQADPDFLSYVAGVKAAIVPADNANSDNQPIGTGPYKYVSRSVQENIKMESFKDYWGGKPDIDEVTFKVCADMDSVVTNLNSGSIDMMAHLTTTQAAQLSDDFDVVEGTMNLVQGLYLNNSFEPFANEKVRQALCYAVDRDEIIKMVSDDKGVKVGSSMFPNFKKYFMPELADAYSYDVEKAKELLAEAGYADGFTFTITVPSNYPQHVDAAQIISEQLKEVGITAQINQVEWNTWLSDTYGNRNYEATLVGVDASYFAASAMLSRFVSDAKNNFVNYSNADYDAAYETARSVKTDEEQVAAYKNCEQILSDTAANVYIQDLPDMIALNKKYTGYQCYPLYIQDISKVKLAE
ncbi:MAG: ABC transporter substrate-binding protein [Lachnospiraceae bacterium]|nr:ABC transporter substrate-binding protein [Lachnospiraceae bacterium]